MLVLIVPYLAHGLRRCRDDDDDDDDETEEDDEVDDDHR